MAIQGATPPMLAISLRRHYRRRIDNTTLTTRTLRRAMKAAQDGPVFITDDGRPSHVLLTIEAYRRLTQPRRYIADALAMPQAQDGDFEPPRLTIAVKPADLI